MFRMTADIKFDGYKAIKPSSLKWSRNIDNYTDTATIVIPALCRMADKDKNYSIFNTADKIVEGTAVAINCGYDGNNDLQFKGFVKRINFKVPVEIECEGYVYQLRRKVINKAFGKTTVREVLNFLIAGTNIKLSAKMPQRINFEPVTFRNYTAVQVLDFLKEKYLLTVFFEHDELYVGWRATYKGNTVKHRLNWNVIKDEQLLFQTYQGSEVKIQLEHRKPNGQKKKTKSTVQQLKPGDVKRVKALIDNEADKMMAVNDAQLKENKNGYTGKLTGFLKPHVVPGMTTTIIDKKYEQRNGSYFIESVEGSFSTGGGRQVIGIAFTVSNNG